MRAKLPQLVTGRLVLVGIENADEDFLVGLNTDPEVMRYIHTGVMSVGAARSYAEAQIQMEAFRQDSPFRHTRMFGMWIIRLGASGERIGWIETFKFSYGEGGKWLGDYAAIGYQFAPKFWGKGYASDAILSIIHYLRTVKKQDKIFAYVRPENKRSVRVLEKAGFHCIHQSFVDEGHRNEVYGWFRDLPQANDATERL